MPCRDHRSSEPISRSVLPFYASFVILQSMHTSLLRSNHRTTTTTKLVQRFLAIDIGAREVFIHPVASTLPRSPT